jgi:hypothetical protein
MAMLRELWPLAFALALVTSCGSARSDLVANESCDGPPGLYLDASCRELAPPLLAYAPRVGLWADGADKERHVLLPSGDRIDTSRPDDWVFPKGTTFYKTFLAGGTKLETRVLTKLTDGAGLAAWDMRAYAWNAEQTQAVDVTDAPPEVRSNVLGTGHDIPNEAQCRECHGAAADVAFSAVQLVSASPVDLGRLIEMDLVSAPETLSAESSSNGRDLASEVALYLNANCAHCHRYSGASERAKCATPACLSGLRLRATFGTTTLEETDLYRTAVARLAFFPGIPQASCRVLPGRPDHSVLLQRMLRRGEPAQMPRIASELVDVEGVSLLTKWINGLPRAGGDCLR